MRSPQSPQVGVAARMMLRSPPRLKVVDLNPHLSCILCGGYFIDATTITECLHSFCRACIVRYLETSEYCPVCEVQVHKSKPLRSDKILQDIVYKLVPGLFHNEMKRRRELYASQPPEALKESRDAEDRGECLDEKFIYAPDEIFSLSIEYGKEAEIREPGMEEDAIPKRRFLRCPAAVTVSHLKKFIRMKYGIPNSYEVDLRYDKESLRDEYSLMDVAYIFLWKRRGPLNFTYKIIERPPKKLRSEHSFMEDYTAVEDTAPTEEPDTKEEIIVTENIRSPPVQPVVPQTQSICSVAKDTLPAEATPATNKVEEPAAIDHKPKCDLPPKTDSPDSKSLVEEKCEASEKPEVKETFDEPVTPTVVHSKKESKSISFKFSPTSLSKSSNQESKPAVMTVAPLTKPSSSLPTTSTTPVAASITHGLYTGISIKKSPPNTLPPFKISPLLLPPRVPPLKLSPPRFSKLESCLRELSSSSKKSSASKKSKSKGSSDKLERKVAQLKSASIKCVAPLVISVPPEVKLEARNKESCSTSSLHVEKKPEEVPPPPKTPVVEEPKVKAPTPPPPPPPPAPEPPKLSSDDDKMDLDSDLFEGRLVIAEPDIPSKDDSDNSDSKSTSDAPTKATIQNSSTTKIEDSEDEEIDVVDDIEVDSGRGSDISRTEARSLCGDDDLGSPDSVPKTPEAERHVSVSNHSFPDPKPPPAAAAPKTNGIAPLPPAKNPLTNGSDCGVLDLSTCSRKRGHDDRDAPVHRAKQVANPAVLDKTRQTTTPCISPNHSPFKVLAPEIPHINLYKSSNKHESSRGNFKCRGNTLTVINPDPNGNRPKIVIRNLGPRPDRGHERFHHHHHNHHHHHQRM